MNYHILALECAKNFEKLLNAVFKKIEYVDGLEYEAKSRKLNKFKIIHDGR
jgi:hypothetical protein